jgi:hypothetical protein
MTVKVQTPRQKGPRHQEGVMFEREERGSYGKGRHKGDVICT